MIRMTQSHASERVVVVGESHAHEKGPWTYERTSARRIKELAGRELTWFNVFDPEPECWDLVEAEARCTRFAEGVGACYEVVWALGTKVCRAFGIYDPEWLALYQRNGSLIRAVPHPSGLNRWWNKKQHLVRAAETLRADVVIGIEAEGALL